MTNPKNKLPDSTVPTIYPAILELIGEDEDESCPLNDEFGYHGKICDEPQYDCYGHSTRNKLRLELRTKVKELFNKED